jgi:hypothetical protein
VICDNDGVTVKHWRGMMLRHCNRVKVQKIRRRKSKLEQKNASADLANSGAILGNQSQHDTSITSCSIVA